MLVLPLIAVVLLGIGLRLDWLMSFTPSPGTVMYAGYGSNLTEAEAFAFRGVHRLRDGSFV